MLMEKKLNVKKNKFKDKMIRDLGKEIVIVMYIFVLLF